VQIARELSPEGALAAMEAGAPAAAGLAGWDAVEPGECVVASLPAAPGFALRAAIAAQLAHRDRRVLCVTNDAGLDAAGDDLSQLARLGLPVIVLVLDAATPARMATARAAGARAWLARDEAELRGALVAAGASGGPALIAVDVEVRGESAGGGL
jgi:thiamine pyrophosphate-dependent acetolactate synthase large subunit-like protein